MQPRSKSEPRDTHALGTRPLVGGVSIPPQFVPMLLAVLMSSPPPAAAKTEAAPGLVLVMEVDPKAAEATEAMEAAAGAMKAAARSMEAAAGAVKAATEAETQAETQAVAVAVAVAAMEAVAATEAVAAIKAVVVQKVMAEVEVEAVEAVEAAAAAATAAGLGAGAGSTEAAGRRPTRESYEHGLHAPLPWCAPLLSVGLGPYLFFGLLLSCAATRRPRLRGYDESNSNPSRTGIGPKRRWLILGGLAVASGFRLPEDNGVARIGADVKLGHDSRSLSHESTITREVDGARDRRRLTDCDESWSVPLFLLFSPFLPRKPRPFLPAATTRLNRNTEVNVITTAISTTTTTTIKLLATIPAETGH